MKRKNYRITFNGRTNCKHIDVYAKDCDEAFSRAYRMPEAKSGLYSDIMVERIPTGPSVIAVKFKYLDTVTNKEFFGYLHIKAKDEAHALKYYDKHFKGKCFWFNASKTEDNGKHIRMEAVETYFASCPGYDADATASTTHHLT